MADRLLTILMFAQYLCASTRTARRIIASGEIPAYRVRGRVMVKFSDVELWLEANRVARANEKSSLKTLVQRAVASARERRAS